jgi:tRNA wybutosine-synthesizing protein 4
MSLLTRYSRNCFSLADSCCWERTTPSSWTSCIIMNVEDTNVEAMAAKMYAVSLGYYPDPFGLDFVPKSKKRDPIINRGYWARAEAFRIRAEEFVRQAPGRQVVSLGCGLDTLFYRLWQAPEVKAARPQFVEVDLPRVVAKKIKCIQQGTRIKPTLSDLKIDEHSLQAESYRLVGADLTQLDQLASAL